MPHTRVFTKHMKAWKNSDKRFIIHQGGTRSSKTVSICQFIIWYSLAFPNKTVSVCRKTSPALLATVHNDFVDLLHEYNLYKLVAHNKTTNTFVFPTKTYVRFFSVDDAQKLRGRKHDLVYINEANELNYEEFVQLNLRTTGKIIMDWNPSDPFSWILGLEDDIRTEVIHSTYKDNPFLPSSLIREIEDLVNKDEAYHEIYALGILPTSREMVFTNITPGVWPKDLDFVYGLDFGYNDPNALMKVGQRDGTLYLKQELYESYLTTEQLIEKMNSLNISKQHMIYADSARPDQIKSLANAGYSIIGGKKNISEGLDYMKTLKLVIEGEEALREFRSYKYKKVKGNLTDVPVDFANHTIDASRYAAMSMKGNFKTSFVVL